MKVYIVVESHWDDLVIYGVFLSKKKAEEFIDGYKGFESHPNWEYLEILEWEAQ